MRKKILRCLGITVALIMCALLCVTVVGVIAQAAGLVDDTVSADYLYSKYPLMNYRLDFYVDNSWGWLPWNWKDGIGKSVMYGIYCITNFVWILSLYLSNATGYVVEQAYKMDFVDDMADMIGRNIQILAGVNENGVQTSGYYVGFLLLFVLILGIYVAYVGLLKRETSKAVQAIVNFILIFVLSAAFIASAPVYVKRINEFSSDVATATLDLGTKVIMPNSDVKGKDSVGLIRDCLFSIQIKQPWMLLQFGDSSEENIGKSRVDKLLSTSQKKNDGKDREDIVKNEIEKNENSNLTVSEVVPRLGMVAFLFIFNIGISMFVFVLAGYMISAQILFIVYALLLPISFVIAMLPTYNGNIKKVIEKLFNAIMLRAGITLIVTVAFSISTMFYNMSTDYPFFMIAFLQIVTFASIALKLNDLLGMFSLNSNDTQQVGRRIMRGPNMFLRRNIRRMERRMGRSIGKKLMPDRKSSTRDRANTQNANVRSTNGSANVRESNTVSRSRNNRSYVEAQNRSESENEGNVKVNDRSVESRPNVKTLGERIGNKIGAVADTKNRVKDNAEQLKEKVKDAPIHVSHKAYEQKKKVRENISGFKRGIKEEQSNRQKSREDSREEYYQNVSAKKDELKQERERKNNKRNNVQRRRNTRVDDTTVAREKNVTHVYSDRRRDDK